VQSAKLRMTASVTGTRTSRPKYNSASTVAVATMPPRDSRREVIGGGVRFREDAERSMGHIRTSGPGLLRLLTCRQIRCARLSGTFLVQSFVFQQKPLRTYRKRMVSYSKGEPVE